MRRTVALFLLLLVGAALARPPSIGTLYTRETSGSLVMTCTATIVDGERVAVDGVAVLTAAHCVNKQLDKDEEHNEHRTRQEFLVTFDEREFFTVHLQRVGRTDRGYDLAVLRFNSRVPDIEPLPFGDWDSVEVGDRIRNYANPLGIGLQAFEGYVSLLQLERPVQGTNIYWRDNSVAIVPGAGGSSGSLILNLEGEVIGVLVGVIQAQMGTPFVVFVPLWKLDQMISQASAGHDITY